CVRDEHSGYSFDFW
nr:immunoglobulin heavy chain junction region [Macaca mulatta]